LISEVELTGIVARMVSLAGTIKPASVLR